MENDGYNVSKEVQGFGVYFSKIPGKYYEGRRVII